ncbi:MAG TPA: DUF6152 family protein [Bryobacteraceae bacterium]|jgi:hypothetical protein
MRNVPLTIMLALILVSMGLPALAHHSFAAEYDGSKQVTMTGTVTKVEWMNPHARFYLDVKEADGTVINWNFELGPVNILARSGWTRNSLKVGDQVSVVASPAKDASKTANARTVTFSDGRRVFAGSSAPDASKK